MPAKTPKTLAQENRELKTELQTFTDKMAHTEAVLHLYNELIKATPGLDNLLVRFLDLAMELYGGKNIIIYYRANSQWHYKDIYKVEKTVSLEETPMLRQAVEEKKVIHIEQPISIAAALPVAVNVEHTILFPLLVEERTIGAVIMEGIIFYEEKIITELGIFFKYLALTLNNEIVRHSKVKDAYDQLEQIFHGNPDGMLFLDTDQRILRINRAFLQLLERNEEECLGEKCYTILPCHQIMHDSCKRSAEDGLKGEKIQFDAEFTAGSGKRRHLLFAVTDVASGDGRVIGTVLTAKDITQRKNAEKLIQRALEEKETMLKEIHHRVKNNLQIIYSLIKLQENNLKTGEQNTRDCFTDTATRVRTMGLIHELLYNSEDLSSIDFVRYIETFRWELIRLFKKKNVTADLLSQSDDAPPLDIGRAIPCGLVVNELITNALKYAFPDNRKGKITIRFLVEEVPDNAKETNDKSNQSFYKLIISDNGVGADEKEIFNTGSLGLTLVQGLVGQLQGTIDVKHSNGLTFTIMFPVTEGDG